MSNSIIYLNDNLVVINHICRVESKRSEDQFVLRIHFVGGTSFDCCYGWKESFLKAFTKLNAAITEYYEQTK